MHAQINQYKVCTDFLCTVYLMIVALTPLISAITLVNCLRGLKQPVIMLVAISSGCNHNDGGNGGSQMVSWMDG